MFRFGLPTEELKRYVLHFCFVFRSTTEVFKDLFQVAGCQPPEADDVEPRELKRHQGIAMPPHTCGSPVEQNGFQQSASGPTQPGCHQAFCPLQAFKYHESDDSRKHGASHCHTRTALTLRGCDQTTPEIFSCLRKPLAVSVCPLLLSRALSHRVFQPI